ncbi:MAG: hypothetical protein P9L93_02080 [Candidatus Gorgyraea atricola]|nr:hypothetical protein [Candidatus Gorgyraea atricola]
MKGIPKWQVIFGTLLIVLSAVVYYGHFLIFRDAHHIFIYLIGDVAFVFIEVLMVTLVLHQLLHFREKRSMLNKLNMVIGAFFSEVGAELLKVFSDLDLEAGRVKGRLIVRSDWTEKDFLKVRKEFIEYTPKIDVSDKHLEELKNFLARKRQFLLNLLENPNLLEHDSFTDLLWAVFHLAEELGHRAELTELPDSDYEHLKGDMERVYLRLIAEWLAYIGHLKKNYPYLFSLVVRTNPFDSQASIIVR